VDPAFDFIVCTRVHTFNSGISPSWSGSFAKYVIITIALKHSGAQHRLQFHHIFPKVVLKSSYSAREAGLASDLAQPPSPSSTHFPDDAGRREKLPKALMAKAPELLAEPPKIEKADVLAERLPG
jgi:hypothetical protein